MSGLLSSAFVPGLAEAEQVIHDTKEMGERQKLVLTCRDINGDGWDRIMKTMRYAERQAFLVHEEALAEICRLMKDGSKWQ